MNAATATGLPASTEHTGAHPQELEMLRASASDFVAGTRDHKRGRACRNALPGYDAGVFRQVADLGWCGILVPDTIGGLGLGFAEMAVILEELGTGLLGEPLAATVVLGGRALLHGDNQVLKGRLLAMLAQGDLQPCLAWQEGAGGLDAAAIATRADTAGGVVRINGRKRFVAGAGAADGFLVSALAEREIILVWVDRNAAGLRVDHEWRADGTPSAVVDLVDVTVGAENIAASPAAALRAVNRAVDEAVVMACAEMCGVIRATLAMTLDYMRTRVQFGKPIGSFQALQHRAVDLFIQQELAGAVLGDAVRVLDSDPEELDRRRIASRAKARACEAGLRITREAVQLHGAIGIQDECDLGLYLKRALVLSAWLGNAAVHRRRFTAQAAAG